MASSELILHYIYCNYCTWYVTYIAFILLLNVAHISKTFCFPCQVLSCMSRTAWAEYHVHHRRNTTTIDQHIEYVLLTVSLEHSQCRHRCDATNESRYMWKSATNINYGLPHYCTICASCGWHFQLSYLCVHETHFFLPDTDYDKLGLVNTWNTLSQYIAMPFSMMASYLFPKWSTRKLWIIITSTWYVLTVLF